MAIFHKRRGEPPPPEVCHRCRARMGTSFLRFVRASEDALAGDGLEAWLCDPCRAEVGRDGADN